jgi:DNA-directed RNA polymerase alpha subunit
MLNPNPELPDNIQIDRVQLPTRIRNALNAAGLRTVGEVREASDEGLLSLQNMGVGSVKCLRDALGLPSSGGVRPADGKWRRCTGDALKTVIRK